jgi:hypothetical protein
MIQRSVYVCMYVHMAEYAYTILTVCTHCTMHMQHIRAGGHSKIFFNSKLQCERTIFLSSAWTIEISDFYAQMFGIKIVVASILDFSVHKKYTLTLL